MIETLKNVDIDKIKPYEKNYQSHDLNREHIKNSIEDFNFDVPIVVDPDYIIVKGHGRYEALKELNHKTVPLVVVNHSLDTKEKAAAARIADNESSRAAQIDNNILKGELLDIGDFFDMGDYGLMDIMGEDEEEFPDIGDGSNPEFQNMTFIVSNENAEKIKEKISLILKAQKNIFNKDENINGQVLAYVFNYYKKEKINS